MTRTEHLLVCLGEEAAEIQHAIAKALRFGLDDGCPGTERTNRADIVRELHDLSAVANMLISDGTLPALQFGEVQSLVRAKKEKVETFMSYARERGTLESERSA